MPPLKNPANPSEYKTCAKCQKKLKMSTNFYKKKNGEYSDLCKTCITMHVDNTNPETFLWILENFDVPYIAHEWRVLYERAYAKNPYKITGMTVLGRYLSKMRLKNFSKFTYKDSDELNALNEEETKAAKETQHISEEDVETAYQKGEISEAQYMTYKGSEAKTNDTPKGPVVVTPIGVVSAPVDLINEKNKKSNVTVFNDPDLVDMPDLSQELTKDDKIYLATKWGTLYEPDEWIALEKLHQEYSKKQSTRPDIVKMICKTSLKMTQAIDNNDYDSYQKLSRTYDQMAKSANFMESQKKGEDKNEFSSFGEIVRICEKEGGIIPRYEIKQDQDIIDTVIKDLKNYNKQLIYSDKALADEIENYLAQRRMAEQEALMEKMDREHGVEEEKPKELDYDEYIEQLVKFDEMEEADRFTMGAVLEETSKKGD